VMTNVILTTNAVKQALDLPLAPDERKIEQAYRRRG
jgi:hypothetical protein